MAKHLAGGERRGRRSTPDTEAAGLPAPVPSLSGDDDVQTFLDQFGEGNFSVVLFRREEAFGEEGYLVTMPASTFSLEGVAERYGGGRFRLQLKDQGRKYVKGSSRSFLIAGPPKTPPAGEAPRAIVGTLPAAADPLSARLDRLEALLTGGARPPADPLDTAFKIVGMFKEQIGGGTHTPAAEMAAAFREGMQLTREMMGQGGGRDDGDGKGESYSAVLEMVGRPLARLIEHEITKDRGVPVLPVDRTPPAPAAPTPPTYDAPMPPGFAWAAGLRPYLPKLLKLAKHDKDPYGWAIVILDELPEDVKDGLREAVQRPDILDLMTMAAPSIAPYRDWFGRFLAEVRGVFEDEAAEAAGDEAAEAAGEGEGREKTGGDGAVGGSAEDEGASGDDL